MQSRHYGPDVLAEGRLSRRRRREVPEVALEQGLVVEDSEGRFCGAVVGYEKGAVTLEDRHGRRRVFPLTPAAFLLEGKPVTLIPPRPSRPAGSARTASGSVAAPVTQRVRAKVARASRIYVAVGKSPTCQEVSFNVKSEMAWCSGCTRKTENYSA